MTNSPMETSTAQIRKPHRVRAIVAGTALILTAAGCGAKVVEGQGTPSPKPSNTATEAPSRNAPSAKPPETKAPVESKGPVALPQNLCARLTKVEIQTILPGEALAAQPCTQESITTGEASSVTLDGSNSQIMRIKVLDSGQSEFNNLAHQAGEKPIKIGAADNDYKSYEAVHDPKYDSMDVLYQGKGQAYDISINRLAPIPHIKNVDPAGILGIAQGNDVSAASAAIVWLDSLSK